MIAPTLTLPEEPRALKSMARTLLDQAPETGLPLVVAGEWIADPLWESWGDVLEERGMDRERFGQIVAGYGNELRLWVVGERPWEHCISGLAGRVERRLSLSERRSAENGVAPALARSSRPRRRQPRTTRWRRLISRIGELHLLYDVAAPNGKEGNSRGASTPPPSSGPVAVLATRRFRSARATPDRPRRRWRRRWGASC